MSSELLYTSAPQGLRHGSRGFCTVLTTAGMPINVISRLEAISSYRHLFAPDSGNAARNPIVFAHQRLNLGGQLVSVVSRIAAHGTDYSGRTNKIAHHVVVEPAEMPLAGPAWLMQQPSVLRTGWLGQCETPPDGPKIPRGDQPPRYASQWRNTAGDAGWAGVVAEAFSASGGQPLWIVYPLDRADALLELIDEAICLLPPAQRWQSTFSTFAANVPPDVDCKVRFVPAGTEEARFAAGSGNAIDLTKHPTIQTASVWVEMARGKVRAETPRGLAGESLSVRQDEEGDAGLHSVWSDEDATPPGPPPDPEPPSLPPEFENRRAGRRRVMILGGIVALIVGLGSTWAVARHLAGLPILPGSSDSGTQPPRGRYVPPPPTNEAPAPDIETIPVQTLTFRLYYDQKQIFDWVLEDPQLAELPTPIRLRGRLRLPKMLPPSVPEDSPDDGADPPVATADSPSGGEEDGESVEQQAELISWGADAQSLPPVESLRIETTKLIDGSQTLPVSPLPHVPQPLEGVKVYWSRATGDLIAIAALEGSLPDERFSGQMKAYNALAFGLSETVTLVFAIAESSESLPVEFRNETDRFLARSLRGREAMVRVLMRNPSVAGQLASAAEQMCERLQKKVETVSKPLDKTQQAALLRIVGDCGRIAQFAADLQDSFAQLQEGIRVDVPELKFLGAEGATLRRVPLQFHFAL